MHTPFPFIPCTLPLQRKLRTCTATLSAYVDQPCRSSSVQLEVLKELPAGPLHGTLTDRIGFMLRAAVWVGQKDRCGKMLLSDL